MTYLCAPIFVRDVEKARRDINAAAAAGADMIELRVDTLEDHAAFPSIYQSAIGASVPVIVTCRPKWEGGHFEGDEATRLKLLESLAKLGVGPSTYVDLELAASSDGAKSAVIQEHAGLILSSHHFQERPERLYNLLLEMDQSGCDVRKIVWTARSIRDNIEAFEILRQEKPTIALCMGEAGIISRILAKKFGAFLTFASLNTESATAPGQISLSEMKGLYRWDKIRRETKVYGVVAHPVGHSMSPAIHNAAFDATGYDGIYLPLLVQPGYESFKAFMESFVPFAALDLCGLSVTLPHKENALRYLQEKGAQIEELAARIGAVNTILIDRDGGEPKLSGINTDYAAILDSITDSLGCTRKDLSGISVAILGAGGTGRTAVAALSHFGAKVELFNRTPEKAAALAEEFPSVVCKPWEKLSESNCRVYINATSVGMHPKVAENPFGDHPPKLSRKNVVFDTIYNPIQTRLLAHARDAGARTISGVEMFVKQAAAQFQTWTGKDAPVEVMQRVVEERLSRA